MDHAASARRSAAALAAHIPHVAGAVGLAAIALIVLPFDGPVAQFIIGFVAGFIGAGSAREWPHACPSARAEHPRAQRHAI